MRLLSLTPARQNLLLCLLALRLYLAWRYRRRLRRMVEQLPSALDHAVRSLKSGRTLADAVLDAFPRGTRVRRPQGGMLLWVEGPEGLDSQAMLETALARSISFAPGLVFSAEPRFGHCLRINCGQPWSTQLAEDIRTLGWLASEQLAGKT